MSRTPSSIAVSATPLTVFHRGFAVSLQREEGRRGVGGYGYAIRHHGLVLHTSGGTYGSAARAENAARRFVDEALGAFDLACVHLGTDA